MSPVPHDPTLAERASGVLTTVEPLLQDASQRVSLVQLAIGGVASKAVQTLDVLALRRLTDVRQPNLSHVRPQASHPYETGVAFCEGSHT
jgi:hypothetical protein